MLKYILGVAVGLAVFPWTAASVAAGQPLMPITGATTQPIGHYEFCKSLPEECRKRSSATERVRLTGERWAELVAVNDEVNRTIAPVSDQDLFGHPEVWAYPDEGMGDCEDFVLLKRRMLMERGWPTGALLITVVRQTNGDGHAVLTVRTDRGDLVLDSLDNRVLGWTETDYLYVKRQSVLDPAKWDGIRDERTIYVGSLGN